MRNFKNDECKICKSTNLVILDQSAQCLNCKFYYIIRIQSKKNLQKLILKSGTGSVLIKILRIF